MSTQDMRKLATVIRSIELIEGKFLLDDQPTHFLSLLVEKTNILHSQYTSETNENDKRQKARIDDSNVHLQLFFQHLEQLLQTDFKSKRDDELPLFSTRRFFQLDYFPIIRTSEIIGISSH